MNIFKNHIFYILFCFIIILSLFRTNIIHYKTKISKDTNEFIGYVKKIKYDENKVIFTIDVKEKVIATYYFNSLKDEKNIKENIYLGDKLKIKGILIKPKNNTVPNCFNYKKYLYRNKIYWQLNIEKLEKLDSTKNIFLNIKNKLINRCDKFIYSKNYLRAFLLGDNNHISDNIKNSYQINGISHLFAISGMHVSLLSSILLFLLTKINSNKVLNYFIVSIFLIFYLFLTNLSPSILRATIFFILLSINKLFKLNIKTINILIIVLFLLLIINPFFLYDLGFQYSFIISFFLILFSENISKYKNYFSKIFIISLISFMVSFPITIYNFYQINILSIFLNLIFVPFISIILFPLSILTFIFPFLDYILGIFINILESFSLFFSNIKILNIVFAKPNILFIIIYFIIIYLIIFNYKRKRLYYIFLLIILLIIHNNILFFNNKTFTIMIDVSQGDSTLIILPHNKGTILVDTGGKFIYNKKQNNNINTLTHNKLIPLFKSYGIKKIDYLILTHGDYDHMGEAINLVKDFTIDKVIFNKGKYNNLELELIKILEERNIKYYKNVKKINIYNNSLLFLNNNVYENENDNSNVIYTEINKFKLLLMGDAGVNVEENIINKYNLNNIDILKVGHHGSKTSSSKYFIYKINPKYSVISVGDNNRYNHPNNEVLSNLKNSNIYRTDKYGSILFTFKNNKLKIKTFNP